jgi:hypothetical protein
MPDLRLPFWVVTDRTVQDSPPQEPSKNAKSIHGFASTKKLTEFLDGRIAECWKVSLVAHYEAFVVAITDAHRNGSTVICFGPTRGAAGSESHNLVELLALADSLAPCPAAVR